MYSVYHKFSNKSFLKFLELKCNFAFDFFIENILEENYNKKAGQNLKVLSFIV